MTRAGLRPIARQTRAYFAPVDRVNGPTAIFDPSQNNGFQLDAPPAPWIDLGWIENFQRTSTSQIEALIGGTAGAASGQARHGLGARVDFEFRDWGKLQMVAGGRSGAHECAGHGSERIASRIGRNPVDGGTFTGGLNCGTTGVGGGRDCRVPAGGPGGMRCGLRAAGWVCGHRHCGGLCAKSGGRGAGCKLCAASYVQRGPSRADDGDDVAANAGVAGGNAGELGRLCKR